jgi:uncharacterized heparinase superfamily protein
MAEPRLSAWLVRPQELAPALVLRARREWRATPIHRLLLARPKTSGLAVRPRDFRPVDAGAGERLLAGQYRFGGETMDVGPGGDPWRRALPSRRFAETLHGFGWAGDLLAAGEAGARELLRLWLEWRSVFGGGNEFAWSGPALERRVFNLATAAERLAPLVSDAEGAAFVADLARQARHLIGEPGDPGRGAERAAVAALVGASLAGPAGEGLRRRSLGQLEQGLPQSVLRDGVHGSRSPERGLELLFDLLALDDALSQGGAPAPVEVSRAIDRLSAGVRFFTLADGRLAAFQGGEPAAATRVAAALALDRGDGAQPTFAPYGGYHRLEGGGIQLIADGGVQAAAAWFGTACAQPGALSLAVDGKRLVAGSSWSAAAHVDAALRGPAGGSCLTLGEVWPGRGALDRSPFGSQLVGAPFEATATCNESDEAAWLDIAHGGWRALGFDVQRRLYLDLAGELRGEDALIPVGRPRQARLDFAIRFHLAPGVAAQIANDAKSALLRPGGKVGWRLRSDAADTRLEPGVAVDGGEARAAQVLVLSGLASPADGARVRWKLSRDDG